MQARSAASRWRSTQRRLLVPLGHKQSGDGAGLFAAGLAPDQIGAADALDALRPLLESAGILKVGFNIKFSAVMLAQHGVSLRNHDDASYVVCAGCGPQRPRARSAGRAMARPCNISHGDLTAAARASSPSIRSRSTGRRPIRPRMPTYLAAVAGAQAAAVAERMTRCMRRWSAADIGAGAHGAARHLDRPQVLAACRRFRPDRSRVESEFRRSRASRSMSAAPSRSHTSSARWAARGTKTKTGAWSTSAQILDESPSRAMNCRRRSWNGAGVELKSTYTDALPTYVHPQTHRVHTPMHWRDHRAAVVKRANLQNIPVRTEDGRKIRAPSSLRPPQTGVGGLFPDELRCWRKSPTFRC